MKTIFRKVGAEKDPSKDGVYNTNIGRIQYRIKGISRAKYPNSDEIGEIETGGWLYDSRLIRDLEWWLEEIELPSDEEIEAKAKKEFCYYENNYVPENTAEENKIMKKNEIHKRIALEMGAKWMRSLAVTAKDNVA